MPEKQGDGQAIVLDAGNVKMSVQVQGGGAAAVEMKVNGRVIVQGGVQVVAQPADDAAVKPDKAQAEKDKADKDKKAEDDTPGTSSAVFFNVDRDIGARLRKAAQLVAAKKPEAAFDLYLYVLENGSDGLFRLDDNRYLGVRDYCMRNIAQLPAEYLTQYRLRVDGDVGRLFEEARRQFNPDDLESLGTRFFLSSHGPEILDLAGDVYAGRGDFGRAAMCWRRLLKWGTSGRVSREMVETKMALALGRQGQAREARQILADLRARDADASLSLGGVSRKVVDYLDAELPKPGVAVATGEKVSRTCWPQLGGEAGHAARLSEEFKCDVKVGELVIPGYDWKASKNQPVVMNPLTGMRMPPGSTAFSPFVPVYADGKVFIHDDSGMMAFRPGAISAEWVTGELGSSAKPNPAANMNMGYYVPPGSARAWACACENGVVYAALLRAPNGIEVWAVSDKGKILWRITKGRVGFEWLAEMSEISDPVVLEGQLYFCVWTSDQFRRECYLVSVDASDGEFVWRRFICSGASMRAYYYGAQRSAPTISEPAARDGLVIVSSNVGGIAALDARSGEIQWGFAYDQSIAGYPMMFNPARQTLYVSCINGTPLLRDGVVYVAPTDSDRVYALDANTGKCVWRVGRGDHAQIVGVTADRMILSGKSVEALDLATGQPAWEYDKEDMDYSGFGFITGDGVYVPGRDAIYRFEPESGRLLGRLLVSRDEEEFGNLLLVEDTMVQVGKKAHFYGLWDRVYSGIESDIRRDAKDPDPHIRLGALYARKEAGAQAIASYEKALVLMGMGDDEALSRRREEVRKRLYVLYSGEIRKSLEADRTDEALTYAVRNLSYAVTETMRTESVLRLVDIYEKKNDWRNAVRQLQSFIEQPPKSVYSFSGGSSMLPALWAQMQIRDLIAAHGREAYADFDVEARKLCEKGLRGDLERVIALYPNSTSALRALARLGEMEAAGGQYRKAAQYLGEYLRQAGDEAEDPVQVKWRLAHYLERDGQYRAAKRVLDALAKGYPDVMVGRGEDRKRLADVVAAKLAEKSYLQAPSDVVPGVFRVPLREQVKLAFGGTPLTGRFADSLLLIDQMGKVRCVDGATGRHLWSASIPGGQVNTCDVRADRLLISGPSYVKMLKADTGEVLWGRSLGNPVGEAIMGNNPANVVSGADFNERYVALNVSGATREVHVLDGDQGGKLLWKAVLPAQAFPMWAPTLWQDRVIVTTTNGFTVYDVNTGQKLLEIANQRPRRATVVVDDGRILAAEMARIACYDITSGKLLWAVPCQVGYVNNPRFPGLVQQDGRTFFLSYTLDRRVVCVDVDQGKEIWSKTVCGNNEQVTGLGAEGDSIFAFTMKMGGLDRSARVVKIDLKTGQDRWASPPMEGCTPRDWEIGRDYLAVLGDVWQIQKMANNIQQVRMLDPMVYCIDRTTGQISQTLAIRTGDDPNVGNRPYRLAAVDEMLWAVYYDRVVGLKAAK